MMGTYIYLRYSRIEVNFFVTEDNCHINAVNKFTNCKLKWLKRTISVLKNVYVFSFLICSFPIFVETKMQIFE